MLDGCIAITCSVDSLELESICNTWIELGLHLKRISGLVTLCNLLFLILVLDAQCFGLNSKAAIVSVSQDTTLGTRR